MGKASRNKNKKPEVIDYLKRLKDGLCLRCGRDRKNRPMMCENCTRYGHQIMRGSKPASVTLDELKGIASVLDDMEAVHGQAQESLPDRSA